MAWTTPVEIAPDPANGSSPCVGGGFPSPVQPPVFFGGKIYIVLAQPNVFQPAGVWRSSDNGATWTGPLDAAHAPGFNNAVPLSDGTHNLKVIYSTAVPPFGIAPVRITLFDMSTETWGANVGDTVGLYNLACSAFLRSDGSIIALLLSQFAPGDVLNAAIWQTGVWTAEFSITTNIPPSQPPDPAAGPVVPGAAGVLDSSDVLHAFFTYANDNLFHPPNEGCLYQRVLPDNTLGAFVNADATGLMGQKLNVTNQPCILGSEIVAPIEDTGTGRQTFMTCPITGPAVFTLSGVFADPDATQVPVLSPGANATTDGNICYIVYGSTSGVTRVCQSGDLVNWTAATAISTVAATYSYVFPLLLPTGLAMQTVERQDGNAFFLTFTTPVPGPAQLGGGASARFRCGTGRPDEFRRKQVETLMLYLSKRKDFWPYVHIFPDPFSIEMTPPYGRIAVPVAGTLTPIVTYQVPCGFRYYLQGIVEDFEGTGGSGAGGAFAPGDAFFTVDQNVTQASTQGAGVQGLISLPVPLGSFARGRWWHFARAYEFEPATILRSSALNVNIAAGAPNFFTSAFLGYLEPVGRGQSR